MASTSTTAPQSDLEIANASDGHAPPSASATSSSPPFHKRPYDVFINHRGLDVKHTLAKTIYNSLRVMGLKAFLDSEEHELEDFSPAALEEEMRSASLHIAIFSPTYAQSPWCLDELSFMLKSGTTIIPVFYRVRPSDLRRVAQGKGLYVNAFLVYREKDRYSLEKLQEWKRALHNASFLNGEIINNDNEEQRVLKNIVHRVVKVMKSIPLQVAKHPVGLEEAVAGFEMTVRESAKTHLDAQIVGIWGMGGSGKTTLAKRIYNQKRLYAERSSFLFDVRDSAAKSQLHKKQIQLLQDLGFNDQTFGNIEQSKAILSNYLRSVRVLVVLDDVDHVDQLDALLPAKDSLAWGSMIIVTTRESEVLRCWGISSIYEMKTMNHTYAKQLFCWHAFLQPFPQLEFEELVENFVSACNGLPLSLKVFGGQLYGCSNKVLWKNILHKISRILPGDIINKLRVSYDALDKEEKQMFLDVACFFIGKDNMTAIAVWEGSGWSGLYGWERLVNKCLVDLDDNNGIRMHDHLKDLGREVANTQLPYRLWSPEQITHIQKPEEEIIQIRGTMMDAAINDVNKYLTSLLNTSISFCGFRRTRGPFQVGLKIFVVRGNYKNNLHIVKLSRELAWLSWTESAHRKLPSMLSLENLRVLELRNSQKLVGLWNWADVPVQLRVLSISDCPKLRIIPKSIGYLSHLKKISLSYCNVESLPEEFCLLQSLEYLQLKTCKMLSSLPSCFGDLKNLQHLHLSASYQLRRLPDSFKQLMLLQHLDLQGCEKLTLQSDILENIAKLQYLNLGGCEQLEELPHHITNQVSLSELYLNATRLRELPINIGQLNKLRVLEIGSKNSQQCFQMQSLPDSMGHLNLLECLVLENLEIESLPNSFKQLINLQTLTIIQCPISKLDFGQGPFTSLCNLKEIFLRNTRVYKISISEDSCPVHITLRVWDNNHLREIDTLPTTVEYIQVLRCKLLRDISGIGGVINLKELMLCDCPELDVLPSFDKLASLEVFVLEGGNKVENIQGLHHCTSLGKLVISGCPELNALPSLGDLIYLKVLEVKDCNKVKEIQGLQQCTSLEKLVLHCKSWELPGIESLEHMQRLRRLQLVAKKRSAVEPCIQMIQKWQGEIIICTKAVAGAGSLLNSSAFPNLSVHSFAHKKVSYLTSCFIRLPQQHSSNASAIMLCLVINCLSPRTEMVIKVDLFDTVFSTEVEEGKWILTGVFTQNSRCVTAQNFYINQGRTESNSNEDNNEVEKGMVVRGEEESVVEAFHGLLALLAS